MRQQNGRFNETADRSFICKPLFSLTDALGTAFVVGLLEIIAGEIETGVTRFIGVSVKTFVLCLGAGFALFSLCSVFTWPLYGQYRAGNWHACVRGENYAVAGWILRFAGC